MLADCSGARGGRGAASPASHGAGSVQEFGAQAASAEGGETNKCQVVEGELSIRACLEEQNVPQRESGKAFEGRQASAGQAPRKARGRGPRCVAEVEQVGVCLARRGTCFSVVSASFLLTGIRKDDAKAAGMAAIARCCFLVSLCKRNESVDTGNGLPLSWW